MQADLFKLQQELANFLIDQLESKKISIKRVAEIAKQVLAIIPEKDGANINLEELKQQLIAIPELDKLEFK